MTIKEGQKWIATQDTNIFGDLGEVISHFSEGDMITVTYIIHTDPYPYYTSRDIPLNKTEIITNFMPLAEWRDKQINTILND